MTKEESINLWKLEKEASNTAVFTDGMKKLWDKVDELINNGDLMYDQFTSDIIDELTTIIVDKTKEGTELDRTEQINCMCNKLYEKYTEQHNNTESGEGDPGVLADTVEVQDESGVCEPEDTAVVSGDNITEID